MISQMIQRSEELGVGDTSDRLTTLMDKFQLPTQPDLVEEFDGLNHEEAKRLVFLIALPIMKHS